MEVIWPQIVISAVAALGGAAALLTILRRTRTRLKLELANNGIPLSERWGSSPEAPPCYVYHLKATNRQRNPVAKNVSVKLAKADKCSNDGSFTKIELPDIKLYWAQPDPDRCKKNINGHTDAECNLGFVIRQDKVYSFQLDVVRQTTADVPPRFVLQPKERMRVEVFLTGDNAKSNTLHLEITWDGKWFDNPQEMRAVRQLS
jgi:hypothetical protein